MVTIRDVAERAGVSIATVSYVLNQRGSVREETRQRVLAAVAELGYRANSTARNLKSQQTRMIGYGWHPMPPDQVHPILDQFLHSLALVAEAHSYHILTFTLPEDPNRLYEPYRELVETRRVDGFVLSNTNLEDRRIRYLMDSKIPFVSFGRANPEWSFPWVDVDNEAGMYAAARHVLQLGHRRVGLLSWPEGSLTGYFRELGYHRALAEAGIQCRPEWLLRGMQAEATGRWAWEQWQALPATEQPTALLAVSDLLAIGILNAAQEVGLEIPGDLTVVGYDDVPMTQYIRPALTTVRQPVDRVGKVVVRMLLDLLNDRVKDGEEEDRKGEDSQSVLIPPRLIVRQSSGRPLGKGGTL